MPLKVPLKVKTQIVKKENRNFLKRLYKLPLGASKADRLKVLNKGNKKNRLLLIHVLHHVMNGEIPLKKTDFPVLQKSGKIEFLNNNFLNCDSVARLLKESDKEQKEILGSVTNFHVLLYSLFN